LNKDFKITLSLLENNYNNILPFLPTFRSINGDTTTYHRGCSFAPANLEGDDCEKIVNPFVNDGIDHLRCHCDEDACNDKMKEITTTV